MLCWGTNISELICSRCLYYIKVLGSSRGCFLHLRKTFMFISKLWVFMLNDDLVYAWCIYVVCLCVHVEHVLARAICCLRKQMLQCLLSNRYCYINVPQYCCIDVPQDLPQHASLVPANPQTYVRWRGTLTEQPLTRTLVQSVCCFLPLYKSSGRWFATVCGYVPQCRGCVASILLPGLLAAAPTFLTVARLSVAAAAAAAVVLLFLDNCSFLSPTLVGLLLRLEVKPQGSCIMKTP